MTENKSQSKLQQKKNKLRIELAKMGVLERKGDNKFDRYKYFSEAQYKKLFTELLSKYGLELSANVTNVESYDGTDKQPFGRTVSVEIKLIDIESGEYEVSNFIGDGLDKGDKAIYKAYTGAIKYYLATTFMVATGDDAEKESPEGNKIQRKPFVSPKSTPTYRDSFILFAKEHQLDFAELSKKYKLNKNSTEKDFKIALEKESNELDQKDKENQKSIDELIDIIEDIS